MGQQLVSHILLDGWEVRFRRPGFSHEQVQHFDGHPDGLKAFLKTNTENEVTAIRFYARRISYTGAPLDLQDHMGEFFARDFSTAEVIELPETWLAEMREEVGRVDNNQMSKFTSLN
jgi:hypothetical protein